MRIDPLPLRLAPSWRALLYFALGHAIIVLLWHPARFISHVRHEHNDQHGLTTRIGAWNPPQSSAGDSNRHRQHGIVQRGFVLVLCHRGQFSNRLYCLSRGLRIARALNRTLVLPIFTDSAPSWIDVADYVNLTCFTAYSQATTFTDFKRQLCDQMGRTPGVAPGEFCAGGHQLHLATAFSLVDRYGSRCRHRGQSLAAMQQLGVVVGRCSELPNVYQPPGPKHRYSLLGFRASLREAAQQQQVLAFCDAFGVDLFEEPAQLAATLPRGHEMCALQPAPALMQAARWAMHGLLPGPGRQQGQSQRHSAAVPAYMAAHVRRGDWFYYCAGRRNCFFSIAEVAACLDRQLKAAGLPFIYIATNADARERQMLLEGISARVLFWQDVREWLLDSAGSGNGTAVLIPSLPGSTPGTTSLDLALPEMVPMLEKAICTAAALFAPSRASTFSDQVVDFRNNGLLLVEVDAMQKLHGALLGHPRHRRAGHHVCAAGGLPGSAASGSTGAQLDAAAAASAAGLPAADSRLLPEAFNYNLLLGRLLQLMPGPSSSGSSSNNNSSSSSGSSSNNSGGGSSAALAQRSMALWGGLEAAALALFDGPAMAAANRFVAMYTSPAFVALRIGALPASSSLVQLLQCVAGAVASSGARALYVSWGDAVRADEREQLLAVLRRRSSTRHVLGLLGAAAEQRMAWAWVYEGSGHGRHAEPALLPSLQLLDQWVCSKAAVLLAAAEDEGDGVYQQIVAYRRAFRFAHRLDGACKHP